MSEINSKKLMSKYHHDIFISHFSIKKTLQFYT